MPTTKTPSLSTFLPIDLESRGEIIRLDEHHQDDVEFASYLGVFGYRMQVRVQHSAFGDTVHTDHEALSYYMGKYHRIDVNHVDKIATFITGS